MNPANVMPERSVWKEAMHATVRRQNVLRSVLSANRVKNQEEKASSDTRDLAVPFRSVSILTRGMAEGIMISYEKRKGAGKWKNRKKSRIPGKREQITVLIISNHG
jgi:hypothetical protein